MNLQTTSHSAFPTGLAEPIPGLLPPFAQTIKKKGATGSNKDGAAQQEALNASDIGMVEDAGLGAMTGLGVAMIFNAGLALAGMVGWEIWLMLR